MTTSLQLCFESTPSQDFDGCYKNNLTNFNEHFYLNISAHDTQLGVKGINSSLNGTVISIFCITNLSHSCPKITRGYTETNIFNFEFITNGNGIQQKVFAYYYGVYFSVCNNSYCSSNATCEEEVCVCKRGYTGDGMMCDPVPDGKFSFLCVDV